MGEVEDLLDRSVAPVPYVIDTAHKGKLFDLRKIDFEKPEKFGGAESEPRPAADASEPKACSDGLC